MSGLRERKKAKTRAAIQEHALRLFRDQGYAETTVQEIADAAEISPATFFRYFPTKEDTIVLDRLDPLMIELFRGQPPELNPTEALRAAIRQSLGALTADEWVLESERQKLVMNAPELRVRMLDQLYAGIDLLAGLAAERTGRAADDFAVRAWAGGVVGVMMATYEMLAVDSPLPEYLRTMDTAFDQLAAGLPLEP
jgi:AcrR family transcriptional regulator